MLQRLFRAPSAFVQSGTYSPSVDGLRFVAFLLVFFHHAPILSLGLMPTVKAYGWAGVDLFFVISAYLLFSNLLRERARDGRNDLRKYFLRRVLRIYPLMLLYIVAMLVIFGPALPTWPRRLAGVLLFVDNINVWIDGGFNSAIRASAHLWTLSFEFQVYAALPVAVSLYVLFGARTFAAALVVITLLAAIARWWLFQQGVTHPQIYATPLFRPEAVFVGIALAIYRPAWHWSLPLALAAVLAAIIVSFPAPWNDQWSALFQYPLIALCAGSLLDVAQRSPAVSRVLAFPPIVSLGVVSYGLYVFHYFTRYMMRMVDARIGLPETTTLSGWLVFAAGIFLPAVVLALLSYRFIERPFLGLKLSHYRRVET